MALIPIKDYAQKCDLSRQRIFKLIQEDRLKTAVKQDLKWFVDENDKIVEITQKARKSSNKPDSKDQKYRIEKRTRIGELVSLEEYARLHDRSVSGIRRRIKDDRMKSAVKIGGQWFLDPKEPIIDHRRRNTDQDILPENKAYLSCYTDFVTSAEYARSHGVSPGSVRQKILSGKMKTAVKVGGVCFLNNNEPLVDHRVKSGKYINNRGKKDKR